jgi:hypothetical protein
MKTVNIMKILAGLATVLLFCSTLGYACDNPIGETVYTLQPGQTQTVHWDFGDCWYGINSWTVYATQPRNNKGFAAPLPPNTPLKMTVVNTTTGEVYQANSNFVAAFLNENCSQDVMVLTLTYSGKKPLSVLVGTYGNLGGTP